MNLETLNEIQKLIDSKIEENLTLEYKREVSSNKEIAKDIAAFANTDGGTIVYGVVADDKVPMGIVWITDTGVEERIQNVAMTAIHPIVESVKMIRLPNPKNELEAIYVAKVPKSFAAPHMVNNLYYRRRGSVSGPMDDIDVRSSIFGSGRTAALRFEISQNLNLASQTRELVERVKVISPDERKGIALIPFQTDAWNSVVASGLLSSLQPEVAERLIQAYRLIHEMNSLMGWLKLDWGLIVHTPIEPSSATHGTYVPSIIVERLPRLESLLREIAQQLA